MHNMLTEADMCARVNMCWVQFAPCVEFPRLLHPMCIHYMVVVTERDIPQGDKLTLDASKISDLQLLPPDANPKQKQWYRGRGGNNQRGRGAHRNKEAFGAPGADDDEEGAWEGATEDFDFAGNLAKFNKDEVFAQFKVTQSARQNTPYSPRLRYFLVMLRCDGAIWS